MTTFWYLTNQPIDRIRVGLQVLGDLFRGHNSAFGAEDCRSIVNRRTKQACYTLLRYPLRTVRARGPKMDREDLLRRISIDPQICFGKPCIRGTRIWVSLILDMLASDSSIEELLLEYPQLERADI